MKQLPDSDAKMKQKATCIDDNTARECKEFVTKSARGDKGRLQKRDT